MKTLTTKDTAEKNLEEGLQELAMQLLPEEIKAIAAIEGSDVQTVRDYLKGKVAETTVGKRIMNNGRAIIIKRERHAAY